MALCLANDIHTLEQMDVRRSVVAPDGKVMAPSVKAPTVQQITIPTTLAGAEFSAISCVTNERTHIKELFQHPEIMPEFVILDPTPTFHAPEWLFLLPSIRAVDHCVEGFCPGEAHPYGDAQALQGLSLLTSRLPARMLAGHGA